MVSVDILEVPILSRGNRNLLFIQDYLTKRPEFISLKDQTASSIKSELVQLSSKFGIADNIYSD